MRSKRFLSMLLVLCMVLSVLSPAASAVSAGENAVQVGTESEVLTESKVEASQNDLVVSGKEHQGVTTLRDSEVVLPEVETGASFGNGEWTVSESDVTADLTVSETPECLEELQEAASYFEKDEIVAAFVVMEAAPLSEKYTSILSATKAEEDSMLAVQDKVIHEIETKVLHGNDLTVRRQFTYLTNAFSIETEFENLTEIAKLSGVKTVFVMPVYQAITTDADQVADPLTSSSGEMTGVDSVWAELDYTGAGMKIAIIDTGLDLDHPSFAADPELTETSMTVEDIEAVLEDLNASDYMSSVTAEDLYYSAKVPFAFNYVDSNLTADHSSDSMGYHGTHVAGIAAANALDGTTVVGMAPDAQLIVMKVFGAAGGAYTDDIVAALEDSMTLGCDVVNASLGSSAGFSSTDTEIDLIYERLNSQDIIATISAGNEGTSAQGNTWGTDMNRTENPDNATISSPSTYANVMSIASANNAVVMTDNFVLADGTMVFYMGSYEYLYGYVNGMEVLAGQELEYVIVDGLGAPEDFYDAEGNSLVAGKVAVVKRGELSFSEKCLNAESAGAAAVIIWNNNDEDDIFSFGMTTENSEGVYPAIPVCLISQADGNTMAAAEVKTMTVSAELAPRDANGGQMSSFSSWGVTPDLRLLPDITGIGGNVYSTADGGGYALMSGTSMSSPQVAGVSALVLQYLHQRYPDAIDGSLRDMAEALMMSTADPIISEDSGVEASPRQQGAGLVDAYEAITSDAYLTVGGDRPKAEMGDSTSGTYTFSFEIHNIGTEDKTYSLSASLLTESIVGYQFTETDVEFFMAGYDLPLTGSVTFNKDSVTVPAGGKANVKVTVKLSDEDKAYFDAYWENGGYVEGFVYLTNEEGEVELNLPYMGFYGDWTEADAFDGGMWYDTAFWSGNVLPTADQYYTIAWTNLGGTDWVLGFNPYSGAMEDENGNIIYDPAHNVVSPNGDGVLDGLDDLYISLLRNTKALTFTFTVDGEIVHREIATNVSKSMYNGNYGQIIPYLYSWYGEGMYDFAGLESGTEVLLTIQAELDYGNGGDHVLEIPITVDTGMPELIAVSELEMDGHYYMAVEASDDVALASIVLMNKSGSRIYSQVFDSYGTTVTEDGTYVGYFDVTELGTDFVVVVCDYGGNETFYDVSYTSAGTNLPEMDETQLYAYRVYDSQIYSDHMYGWVSLDKPAQGDYANLEVWTDDYLEYAAINAAEYVDGKIFAVDAVYNLVVMDPGLFDRNTICNLGKNVLDMTFDDSTDTMYVLTKEDSYYVYLYTMDLLTGELTQVKYLGAYYSAPMAIADDDNGTLYAIKYGDSAVYTLTAEGNWVMTKVTTTDADGVETNVVITDSTGNNCNPQYAQGLTYADGNLYWAYYRYSWTGDVSELITINTADWTFYHSSFSAKGYDEEGNLVDYYPDTELVGLFTMDETDYEIPEGTEVAKVLVSSESLLMKVGDMQTVTASVLPWNYDAESIIWTSSDESVATVNNGKVTGVSEGTCTITVNADGVETTIDARVVLVEGHFNAYNYYSYDGYYGYMIDVDMSTMDYTLNDHAPVDFISGDYNGHDGCFYGYTEVGQLYRWNLETNELTAIGSPDSFPIDMAYDYSTGLMYGMFTDLNSGESKLGVINMNTGAIEIVLDITGTYMMSAMFTLACDDQGTLYTIDAGGYLYTISRYYDDWYGTWAYGMSYSTIYESLGTMNYVQSMCWDHENGVLLWAYCDGTSVNWINVEEGYMLPLGDPTESGLFEFVGMYTVPAEIPELSYTAVEEIVANDMLLLIGGSKPVDATIYPFNATNQDLVLTSADESIAKIENGIVTGVGEGETTISYKLVDGENVIEGEINVTVLQGADNVYGHILADLTYGTVQNWAQIYPEDTQNVDYLAYTDYTIFAEEYVDGVIYAYGYDPADWTANWQFMTVDPTTFEITSMTDMGEGFPYVYDMTYDYATDSMYCVAGASEEEMNVYIVDMNTGKATLLLQTEQNFMSIAAARDGKLYAIENSQYVVVDEWDPWATPVLTNAQLYCIDAKTLEVTHIGDTGMQCDMIASMAYDYDTDAMYWTPLSYRGNGVNGLAIVDLETAAATNLGSIASTGSQVAGLYIIADEYPEADTSELYNVIVNPTKTSLNVGSSFTASLLTVPVSLDGADVVWTSSNNNVATVDQNGTVTAVAQGKATITATVTYNGKSISASCTVSVLEEDAAFLSWNRTDKGWSLISRSDYSVTNMTEGEEVGVSAIASVGTDVYGYDVNNGLFQLNTETYEREYIATELNFTVGAEFEEGYEYSFEVRDMAYDYEGERMLVLGATRLHYEITDESTGVTTVYDDEINGGCSVYAVDLTTGEMTKLYTFSDIVYVYSMACGTDGTVYFYNTFNDVINKLDLASGTYSALVSLQNQSLYGEYGGDIRQAMHYDTLTDTLFMTFTSNGKYYRMVTVDAATGALTAYNEAGSQMYIGEITRVGYSNVGDLFSGLTFVDESYHKCYSENFTDIALDAWYHDAVDYVVGEGLMNGMSETVFAPYASTNRAMMVTVLYRLAGSPSVEGMEHPFTDVVEGSFYYNAVIWAYNNGIVNGISETLFNPSGIINREQMVTMLWRFAGEPEADLSILDAYTDASSVSNFAKAAYAWAVENGIVTGTTTTTLSPTDSAQRVMIAVVLMRYANLAD